MSYTHVPKNIRTDVLASTDSLCYLCGQANPLDLHHICPEYANGLTNRDNLTPLCSNHLGGNACHIAIHAKYRNHERIAKRVLTQKEYQFLLDTERDTIRQLADGKTEKDWDMEVLADREKYGMPSHYLVRRDVRTRAGGGMRTTR